MSTTASIGRRSSSSAPRGFVVPVVREMPRPAADPAGLATIW